MAQTLVLSRDPVLRAFVARTLEAAGHSAVAAASEAEAMRAALTLELDAAVIDLPGDADGREVASRLRSARAGLPLVYVAPPGERWAGRLDAPFVCKPVSAEELVAAVEAEVLAGRPDRVEVEGITIDRRLQVLAGRGGEVTLTPTEFRLMVYLEAHRGDIASPEQLLERVWDFHPGTGSGDLVRSHIRNLRVKIRQASGGADLIKTVPRRGYRLVAAGSGM